MCETKCFIIQSTTVHFCPFESIKRDRLTVSVLAAIFELDRASAIRLQDSASYRLPRP